MNLKERYETILLQIESACKKAGRQPNEVKLIAVSKGQPVEAMLELEKISSSPVIFGENYIQELKNKAHLVSPNSEIHFIGGLQTNKAKEAVKFSHVIESVDSRKLVFELDKEAKKRDKVQEVFLQVNISNDPKKRGFSEREVISFCNGSENVPNLKIKGLMTITELYDDPEKARSDFRKMRELRGTIDSSASLSLSMGMSNDFEVAIEEGATHVRIGTALFGERGYP